MDWLALLTTHIPNRGEQMVRYYGYYSNKSRGIRKKEGKDDAVPSLIESDFSLSAFRKNWVRLYCKGVSTSTKGVKSPIDVWCNL